MAKTNKLEWFLLNLIPNSLSLVGCIWLICRLRRYSPHIRSRLFPRQLLSLAFADLVFHVTAFPVIWIDYSPSLQVSDAMAETICQFTYIFFRIARYICLLHEMHIALSFMVQVFRCTSALLVFNRCLPSLWLLGFFLGTASSMGNPWSYDASNTLCAPTKWRGGGDWISILMLFATAIVCTVAYLCVVVQTCQALPPQRVKRHNFRRACAYVVNFFFTYGLILGAYLDQELFTSLYFVFATALEFCNGSFNTLTYACQSRYVTAQLRSDVNWRSRYCETRYGGSFRVDIGGVDISEIVIPQTTIADDLATFVGQTTPSDTSRVSLSPPAQSAPAAFSRT